MTSPIDGIIWDWIGTIYERNKGLYPWSRKVLVGLKQHYRFGLVTIAKHGILKRREELEETGVLHLFDSVIIDTIKTPEHYLRCMREMGTAPERTAIVDDRTIRGIKIGNQLGFPTFWIQKGEYALEIPNEETGDPTYRINTIEDLLELL
ncbi:HAD family hydrolase [Nanoarchaeota archaeon]